MAAVDPFFACIYGPSGAGKTCDTGYSFVTAVFVAAPGALTSIKSVCGYQPREILATTLDDLNDLLPELQKKNVDTLVVDDFSFLAQRTLAKYEEKGVTGYKLWGKLKDTATEFRDKARYAGLNVVISCWEQAAKNKPDGSRMRGGPALPGILPEQLPAMCDIVLRAVHEPNRKPWPAVYRCALDPAWAMKDRFDVASRCDPAPMNLAELLRARNVALPRLKEHDKLESRVEKLASAFSADPIARLEEARQVGKQLVEANMNPIEVRWTLRDALDRAHIRHALTSHDNDFLFGIK